MRPFCIWFPYDILISGILQTYKIHIWCLLHRLVCRLLQQKPNETTLCNVVNIKTLSKLILHFYQTQLVCICVFNFQPDQTTLAVWGSARARHERTEPEEAAPADQGSVEGPQAEPGLWTGGSPAAFGPTGKTAALPQCWKERYAKNVQVWKKTSQRKPVSVCCSHSHLRGKWEYRERVGGVDADLCFLHINSSAIVVRVCQWVTYPRYIKQHIILFVMNQLRVCSKSRGSHTIQRLKWYLLPYALKLK